MRSDGSSLHRSAARRSCQTIAGWAGFPVLRSHTMVVSRWFVIPTASSSLLPTPASRSASSIAASTDCQMSSGSCSTQPGCGNVRVTSRQPRPRVRSVSSRARHVLPVVPWSMPRSTGLERELEGLEDEQRREALAAVEAQRRQVVRLHGETDRLTGVVCPVRRERLREDVGPDTLRALALRDTEVVDPPVRRIDVDHRQRLARGLPDVDGTLLEPFAPGALGKGAVREALRVEAHGRLQVLRRAAADRKLRWAALDAPVLTLAEPEHGRGATARRETRALEQDASAGVPRPERSDHAANARVVRPLDRGVEEERAELLTTVARRDERPEEVGMVEAGVHLDSGETHDLAVQLVDEQRFLG